LTASVAHVRAIAASADRRTNKLGRVVDNVVVVAMYLTSWSNCASFVRMKGKMTEFVYERHRGAHIVRFFFNDDGLSI
jgi:hypothetical protein